MRRCWRDGAAWPVGTGGAAVLILYGIIPTFQPSVFGRTDGAYGVGSS
jgi:drug/metabolite transporter superfamily protein YnfA